MQDKENLFIYNYDETDEVIRDVFAEARNKTYKAQALWSQNGKLYFNK